MSTLLKLNLGCGQNQLDGFVNVDKFGEPQVLCDLEVFPWPWADNSVGEIMMNHVLEHLGARVDTYIGIFKELYRVCAPNTLIHINVPHPRHDDFLSDPTHVRPVTPDGLMLFSKARNRDWAERKIANSPLGLYHNVDFQLVHVHYGLEPSWLDRLNAGQVTRDQVLTALRTENNVAKEIQIVLQVVKQA